MARAEVRATPDGPVVQLVLSQRNLLALLVKLHQGASARTFEVGDRPDAFARVYVSAESDVVHYDSPSREGAPSGPLEPICAAVLDDVERGLRRRGP